MNQKAKICRRCVLDESVDDIRFDEVGVCNYCKEFDKYAAPVLNKPRNQKLSEFEQVVDKIKKQGRGKKYDCILGLSGGADSSFMALLAKEHNLRPLVVHFDNGWNTELAVKNIEQVVSKLNFELHTYVINWESFRELQLAYLRASVVDTEVPTDHLIFGSIYKLAFQKKIKTILSGANAATEFTMPNGWNFMNKADLTNLKAINKRFGSQNLKKLPTYSYYKKFIAKNFKGIKSVSILNLYPYSKQEAKQMLKDKLGWKDYGYKHYESVFTRFYQGYILPKKFGIDKRKAHLSTLINSGEITREQALEELSKPPYPVDQQLEDREYVIKKLGITEEGFNEIMNLPIRRHAEFGMEQNRMKYKLFNYIGYFILFKIAHPLGIVNANKG